MTLNRDQMLRKLVDIQYQRSDYDFHRGTFRVRGDIVEIFPAYEDARRCASNFSAMTIETISEIDPIRGKVLRRTDKATIYPASHYVTGQDRMKQAVLGIRVELKERLKELQDQASCLKRSACSSARCTIWNCSREMGFCPGIENYSRHLTGRQPGEAPPTLLSYFPSDFLLFIDESHVTVPQVGGMYRGDRSRKETLVEYGFRLPSALDNRPLNFEEFEACLNQTIYVSATPAHYEFGASQGAVVEQVIRPTGLMDPVIDRAPGAQSGRRPAGRDPQTGRAQRAGSGHHADQAHGGRPDRVLSGLGREGALPSFGHRNYRARRDHSPAARRGSSTSWSASTCCAKGSICRKFR